jgi:hypothetical protein
MVSVLHALKSRPSTMLWNLTNRSCLQHGGFVLAEISSALPRTFASQRPKDRLIYSISRKDQDQTVEELCRREQGVARDLANVEQLTESA